VLRCPDGLERLLEVADGRRTVRELAEATGFPAEHVLETVDAVIEAGALRRVE
jgi:DNA-binding Lrp family transcriptional regulator